MIDRDKLARHFAQVADTVVCRLTPKEWNEVIDAAEEAARQAALERIERKDPQFA